ncbi:Mannose-6-phosphate isomerase, class I [Chitinophaga sp. CF118]|uniref:class I mannose-6-phosphate isomerase n=1 Tax=Chitinophaga sp. CF118 TaxID=1884367 RepID=UPI0008E0DC98|nr:class I mannose-6-phosphate isomerase [Chitinophaga sp. CF118]SFD46231.1 Mannose-6-phosphate isomerase, class I [Chitinophaga sp. CF118]
MNILKEWRNSGQPLLPVHIDGQKEHNGYNIYPVHELGNGKIHEGYTSLANWMATQNLVLIDGYTGVFWNIVYDALDKEFRRLHVKVKWHFTENLFKDPEVIDALVIPFIGKDGDVWGTKSTLSLADFFDADKLVAVEPDASFDLNIVLGTGAALTRLQGPVVFLEIAKNELQYRMRAGEAVNLGSKAITAQAEMYKRFYFVDWVVLNEYKRTLMNRIRILGDAQWYDTLTWITSADLQEGIAQLCNAVFRVRPWFEPGAWGGQWMKEHIEGLNKEEVNYAWSFEMIVPENGVLFGSSGNILELPFEWMMFYQYKAILGKHADIFKYEFPIRFDFLDTFDGGNLSIQCHPSLNYIREYFGETFTQDETYYILDCKEDAVVYLGFQEGINAATFRKELEFSRDNNQPLDIEQYVQKHKANKHDLFLIPNSTVHSAGANNMVLEISATPYIFTFKMYDWLRRGLDDKPRAINIPHAFNNLNFSRQGSVVNKQLLSVPKIIEKSADWQVVHLPTHADHFYDVHRLEFDTEIVVQTYDCCLVMMLVEGSAITVIAANGESTVYQYAETFVIPAATKMCLISNLGKRKAKVIKAFLKEDHYIFNSITSI